MDRASDDRDQDHDQDHEPGAVDDLARVLGYVDAADHRDEIAEIGPEMYVVPFWTPQMCAAVIRAAEAVGGFEPHPDDPVPGHEISLAAISPRLYEAFQDDLGMRLWPLLQQHWPLIDYHGLRDAFVIKYAPGEQDHLRLHHDVAQVSASMKLNDDYTGAVLEFARQGVTNEAVPIGSLVVWPSLVTHPHGTTTLTAGVKYGLTVWFELPEQYA